MDRQIAQAEALGYGRMPVCVAKTQRSLSDDPTLLNRPRGFRITINDVRISSGAGFLVALAGDITTMPGLPRKPNAEGVGRHAGRDDHRAFLAVSSRVIYTPRWPRQ